MREISAEIAELTTGAYRWFGLLNINNSDELLYDFFSILADESKH